MSSHPTQLSDAERQLLARWNQTAVDYPRDIPLHKFIEDQVERTPEAVAVVSGAEPLTYRELNGRANRLAHHLRKLGVGPDVLVPVCAERSLEMVVALLGSMKAGGAYTPLDPEYPQQRLQSMLEDSAAPVVLTQAHLESRVPASKARVICLDRDWPLLEKEDATNLQVALSGKNLAYCIYTSGSTGKPKGVPNVHEGIVNRLFWMRDEYKLVPADRVLQKTPYSFDVSVWEFFLPLITGATLVMARPGGHRDPAYLVNIIQEQRITTLHFVPSMLALFLETEGLERCTTVRQVFASGEALSLELQSRFFKRFHGKLHNLYGPTEAAVDVTYWECTQNYSKPIVPIGRPVANTQIHILDEHVKQVPIGESGELHIGGIQLARGYLNRPELNAQKFIPDPFRNEPGARLYKTGDLARYLPDGNIEYLGRIDHQVKLRGFRIELGEIEAVLTECPGVRQAAVIVREDVPGNQRLVAYMTRTSKKEISLDAVRAHLTEKLPEFMVPSCFVTLDDLPLTTSGKVDRKLLPKPERDEAREMVSARNELELTLLPIFEKILGVGSMGVTDDFFELGGQSILAARLLAEVQRVTGHAIPLSAMLRAGSVESMALLIANNDAGADSGAMVQPLQKGEPGHLPFFAVAVPGVEALGYAALARHLGPQQPVYKLQGKAPIVGKRPYTPEEIRGLGQQYVAAMRSVQLQGPYCFIGMCDDVQVCEEMTVQLERAGEQVGFFANLDTWTLQNTMIPWRWKVYYYATRLGELTRLHPMQFLKAARAIFKRKVAPGAHDFRESGARTPWQQTYWPGPGYKPAAFEGPVLLFKRPKQPYYYVEDRQMGWGGRARRIEMHEMDLDHDNLLREPHIKAIGAILAARLHALETRKASAQVAT